MKRMPRVVDLATLFIFLIAVTINCPQSSQVTSDPIMSAASMISESDHSKTGNSEFLIADDESDDTSNLIHAQNTITPIDAVLFSVTFPSAVAATVKVKQTTVLRL